MAALFTLVALLRSQPEKMTSQEESILSAIESKALRDSIPVSIGASIFTACATQRLDIRSQIILTMSSAVACGFLRLPSSLDASTGQILSLDGSRMQKELANIILRIYPNSPREMRQFRNFFFSEEVYDDSTADKPKLRWRRRNHFVETDAYLKEEPIGHFVGTASEITQLEKSLNPLPEYTRTAIDIMSNPFDCLFDCAESAGDSQLSDTAGISLRQNKQSHKRRHRKHRIHRQGAFDS